MYQSDYRTASFRKRRYGIPWLLLFICIALQFNCGENHSPNPAIFVPIPPTYGSIRLIPQPDTLHFLLTANTYNEIKSFNQFTNNDSVYISFYDRRSESVSIYNFYTRQVIKQIWLKKRLKNKRLYKTSVFTCNFDSLFITNLDKLYLMDSAGKIKKSTTFLGAIESMAFYETTVPVVIRDNITYMGVRAFVKETSLSAIRNWKVLCGFNLHDETHRLYYPLPEIYQKGLYGRRFLEYSYCYNEKGNFVFSFPADTNVYETNLSDYHKAYYAKSRFQQTSIEPVSKTALENDEGGKEYTLRNSYGPIYYDPYKKRYLRIAKQKVTQAAYESKNYRRSYSIIVMDQHFKIIGEFDFNDDFALDSIFFSPDSGIYAQVNRKDEQALHFVQLEWSDESDNSFPRIKK